MRPELSTLVVLVALALASMIVFARTAAVTHRKESLAHRGSFVLGPFLRAWFYWFVGPVERGIIAMKLVPEVFNALGVAFGIGALFAFAYGALPLGGWLLLIGGICDVFDGQLARAQNKVSNFGAFLDSTLDRFHEVAVFIGLGAYYGTRGAMLTILVALAGSLLVSYTRARGESLGVTCKLGILQRAERLLLLGFGAILDPTVSEAFEHEPGFLMLGVVGLIAAGSMGTAIFRTWWISRELKRQG